VKVPFSYLPEQFAEVDSILDKIRGVVGRGDFTLGRELEEFEESFAALIGVRHAIGVNSGTDALRLSLKALGVGSGDQVITAANTFVATVSAIEDVGARTVFVDCGDDFCLDLDQVEAAITPHTKALMPVHLTGSMVDMQRLRQLAQSRHLPVVEDACQAICASLDGKPAGSWGDCAAFSLHPLKFINIWGDGGVVTTDDSTIATRLRRLRNHGLADRDTVISIGCNSRLDTIQAVVATHVLKQAAWISDRRNANAAFYDRELAAIPQITVPKRNARIAHSFVTYQVLAERRDSLVAYCAARNIECKIHYPRPLYAQQGLKHLGYKPGDFPVADRHAATAVTLPVHQYLSQEQLRWVVSTIAAFYEARGK
jgi:dTDP-3-amino-2,3,6-trideoxy-4-keto-D-glucose/dTDP-3-amino-3,4,6-trideoxy-alpha-D-glucose/dTDP-2,6-dideoxy-D-kanosamine transaminase